MFEQSENGCKESIKYLIKEGIYDTLPANCTGFCIVEFANDVKQEREESPYFLFSEVFLQLTDLKNNIEEEDHPVSLDDLAILEDNIGNMISKFTQVITDLDENCSPCY